MTDLADDTEWPELEEGQSRERGKHYINDTRGLWVRKNYKDDVIEIWVDGNFAAAWRGADRVEVRLQTMLREAFELGLRRGIEQNQTVLRSALGLSLENDR